MTESRSGDQGGEDRPPRRAMLAAVLAVIILAGIGVLVAKGLIDMARLQDCALGGRRAC